MVISVSGILTGTWPALELGRHVTSALGRNAGTPNRLTVLHCDVP